jgi:hypothetical protein
MMMTMLLAVTPLAGQGSRPNYTCTIGDTCPLSTPLIAGQDIEAGTVTISNNNTYLDISVTTTAPWLIKLVHIYVGTDPVEENNPGNFMPGHFTYHEDYNPPYSSTYQLRVDISDIYPDAECGETEFYIAVHTDLYNSADGTEEGGWACGDYPSPGRQWSWSFTYTPCCSEGCTLTQGYWKTHSSYGPAPYDATWATVGEDTIFTSGYTWYEALWESPEGDAYWILAHQYIAAVLNGFSGASTTEVLAALSAAAFWFENNDPGVSPSSDDGQLAVSLSETLAYYNEGIIGPGHCEE